MKLLILLIAIFHFSVFSFSQDYWGSNTESEFTNEAMDLAIDAAGNAYTCGYITGETAFDMNIVFQSAQGNGDIYVAKYNPSGNLVWVKKFGGSFSDRAYALALDQSGNVYVTGQYFGSVNFGTITLQSNANSKDIFILKLNSLGDVIWAKTEGGSGAENVYDIALDGLDNVIITGQFSGAGVLQNQNYQSDINPQLNQDSYDLFVAKYTSSGNPLWVQVGNAIYEDRGMALGTDSQNNIYLSGQFSDTLTFAGQIYNNNGYNVGFLCQLNANGQVQWFNYLRASMVLPYNLTVSDLNEVYLTGDYRGNLLYLIQNQSNSISNPYTNKIFVLKTNSSGAFQWGKSLGSESELSARAIAIDAQKNAYITGYFSCALSELHPLASSQFNSVGFRDIYMWSLSNLGTTNYAKQIGGKKDDIGRSVAVRSGNDVVTCGSYTNDLFFPTDVNSLSYSYNMNSTFHFVNDNNDYLFLNGNQNVNSFLSNALNNALLDYTYFHNSQPDSLLGYLSLQDTIQFCDGGNIAYQTFTSERCGPEYDFLWNTSENTPSISVNQTGMYSVDIIRKDECISNSDSLYVIINHSPALPLMTDSLDLAVNESGEYYFHYVFCDTTEVPIWFTQLEEDATIKILFNDVVIQNDTLTHSYNSFGHYDVLIENDFCSNQGTFEISLLLNQPYDTISPYLKLVDLEDYNDSISICRGELVYIQVLDSLTNPTGILDQFANIYENIVQQSVEITRNAELTSAGTIYPVISFNPTQTGWYLVKYRLLTGYDNMCGTDTTRYIVIDSFYVEVLELPTASTQISVDNLLCPNGSVYLTLSSVIPDLVWYGPGIVWQSSTGDSIQANQAGTYSYSGYLVDTTNACSHFLNFSYTLQEKTPPNVNLIPQNGIVCPYDSIYMQVPNTYLEYSWTGPSGTNLSSVFEHTDTEIGFYYCTVLDNEGCYLTTPPSELKEYTTPYLQVAPSIVLCENETATIEAVTLGGTVQWQNLAFGSDPTIQVSQAGWYVCNMIGCGITVSDSIEIIDGRFSISITASDTFICENEITTLQAQLGYYGYEWSNGQSGNPTIEVEESGMYSVIVQNQYGCSASSTDIFISEVPESIRPNVSDESLCTIGNVHLNNSESFSTSWYDLNGNLLFLGNPFDTDVLSDTAFLVAHVQSFCTLNFDTVFVSIASSNLNYSIQADDFVCSNDSIVLSINSEVSDSLAWNLGGVYLGSQNPIVLPASFFSQNNQVFAYVSNACVNDTFQKSIQVFPMQSIHLVDDSLFVCKQVGLDLNLDESFHSGSWTGYFGNFEGENLQLSPFEQDGFITVSALDTNGCQTDTALIYVSTSVLPMDIFTSSTSICFGDTLVVAAIVNADSLFWTTPAGMNSDSSFNVISTPYSNGWYFLTAFDSLNCEFNDSIFVQTNPNPLVFLPSDTTLCLGNPIDLASWAESYDFVLNGNISSNTVIFNQDQWMYLTYSTDQNCTYSDSVFVQYVNCDDELLNVFTPNGDGVNDYFSIDEAIIFPNNKIIIYNRWGNVVFEESGYRNTFNGEGLTPGVYFYLFYRDFSNQPGDYYRGFVELIR